MTILTGSDAEDAFVEWCTMRQQSVIPLLEQELSMLRGIIRGKEDWITKKNESWTLLPARRKKQIDAVQKALVQDNAKMRRLLKEIDNKKSAERGREEFRKCLAVPRIAAIDVQAPMRWYVHTDDLYSFDARPGVRTWHKIGALIIDIDLSKSDPSHIRWRRAKPSLTSFTAVAPQIFPHGTVCLGQAQRPLEEAFRLQNYVALVSIAVRFAEFGKADQLRPWPTVDECEVPQWYLDTEFRWA